MLRKRMSSSDNYLYETSILSDDISEPFLSKKNVYVLDSNATSDYTGQVIVDCSQLSNSFSWVDWKSAVLEMPFTVLIENTDTTVIADMSAVINSFFCGLKSGSHHLINSISVNVNNTSVVSLTNYLNHYVSYKLLTTMSQDEIQKFGTTQFFSKDNATSVHFGNTRDGPGFSNNRPNTNVAENYSTQAFKATYNTGFAERLRTPLDFGAGVSDAFYTNTTTKAICTQNGISYFETDTNKAYLYILATIRLRDIVDLFNELPLVRGTYVNMIINLNTSTQTLSYDKDTETFGCAVTNVVGLTNPLLISSAVANQPNAWLSSSIAATKTGTFEVACNVGTAKTSSGASKTNPIMGGRCRLYVDLYQMNPLYEERYLSLRTKQVFYKDIYSYLYQNQISAGATFNTLVTNGISRPLEVVVIPYVSKSANTGLTSVPIYQSPFAAEPGTTSPIALTNFNILVSGTALFQSDIQYDFNQFLEETARTNAINGGQSNGFMSGLISQQDFTYSYRFYVADLSRRLEADNVARSIELRGTNNSSVPIDLLCFVVYERSLTIALDSGALTSTF